MALRQPGPGKAAALSAEAALGLDASRLIHQRAGKRIYAQSASNRAISVILLPDARRAEELLRRREELLAALGDCPWLNLPMGQRVVAFGERSALIEEMPLASDDGPGESWESDLTRGIQAMHRAGWAHMDLKPEHLLWVGGHWRIHDFDSAMRIGQRIRYRDITYAYAPPEVRWHDAVDAGDDLYAAALMLYRRRNGMKLPFERGSEALATFARFALPKVPIPRDWDAEAQSFFRRALARARGKRFRSAEEFIDAWRRLGPI